MRRLTAGLALIALLAISSQLLPASAAVACVPQSGNARVCLFHWTNSHGDSTAGVFVINTGDTVATVGLVCVKASPKSHYALQLNHRDVYVVDLAAKCPKL